MTDTTTKRAAVFAGICGFITNGDGERVPVALMVHRSDGTLGFPGGKVEEGETIVGALHRECVEEVNIKWTNTVAHEAWVTHTHDDMDLHFTVYVEFGLNARFMADVIVDAMCARDFGKVSAVWVPLSDAALPNVFASSLAPMVREEIDVMLRTLREVTT